MASPTRPPGPPRLPTDFPSHGPNSLPRPLTRALAWALDLLILVAPMTAVYLPFFDFAADTPEEVAANVPLWVGMLAAAMPMIYEIICGALFSRTIGKAVFGIKIVNYLTGKRISPAQAMLRSTTAWLGIFIGTLLPMVGFVGAFTPVVYVSAVIDPIGRGFHDKAAGTIIVRA